jgi:hypothetical protein
MHKKGVLGSVPKNKAGDRIGELTLLKIVGTSLDKSKIWECLCDCGAKCSKTHQQLTRSRYRNCNALHHQNRNQKCYPKTPEILPAKAVEILSQYLPRLDRFKRFAGAEDHAWLGLQRAAYIIYWREEQGHPIESPGAYVEKMLYIVAMYSRQGKIKEIKLGSTMTSEQSNPQDLAQAETNPDFILPRKCKAFKKR